MAPATIYACDGARGFFKGLVPTLAKPLPASLVTFLTYEQVSHFLKARPRPQAAAFSSGPKRPGPWALSEASTTSHSVSGRCLQLFSCVFEPPLLYRLCQPWYANQSTATLVRRRGEGEVGNKNKPGVPAHPFRPKFSGDNFLWGMRSRHQESF